ncbi:MAG: 16S rRNA (guanine(966)-N(2))-methyltransferase RsmD [Bacteroidales bacterium]|nr:16S rRNA (guanine(966)-N(2))-methyltransferase RsmD [Bacteroidales bacterium]
MRIITGKYKGMNLLTVPGNTTRPTTDYQREVIFSMYQDYSGLRVLDLYAGTGSFGLETLSRGADWVDFVEFSNKALTILIKNIAKLKCGESCHVHRRRVEVFLSAAADKWDVIFLDPPYKKNLVNETIRLIKSMKLLTPDGIIIAEHHPEEKIADEFRPDIINYKQNSRITAFTVLQNDN